ncbi:MAG TPA: SMP-30/gluconolactonase/LRE family protein [Planctomycetota bacterium]|nr:SMP-30/gluconolactonase/LRE family protein [Planctomycetota bacterium]
MRQALLALLIIPWPAALAGQPPAFTRKLTATRLDAGKVKIEFTIDRATDVAVHIEDERGRILRHLAAGVLGPNAPEPLAKGSLAQALLWDRKDDLGRPVPDGACRARVRLGLRPAFDGFLGFNPAAVGSVRALAVGPGSELFVFHCFGTLHPSDNSLACSVFSRDGTYRRTILPYPANLPDERLKGLKRIELGDGAKVPFLYQAETRSLVPGAGDIENHEAVATRDGRVAFVGRLEVLRYAQPGPIHVVEFRADGSVPEQPLKTRIFEKGVSATLALSPDETTIYASDVRKSKAHYGLPVNIVYRFGWDDQEAKPFLGGPDAAGDAALDDPKGIACDKEGSLFVADKGHDRVAVFRPDGAFVGALKTTRPERVAVHRATGALYVLGGPGINELVKFNSWKDPQPVATAKLPTFKHDGYRASMALDDQADPPVLWVGSHQGYYARFTLIRIEDKGAAFGEQVDVGALAVKASPSVGAVTDLNLDREREWLYANTGPRFDGRTGKREGISVPIPRTSYKQGAVIAAGLDGFLYLHSSGKDKGVYRFDRDLKPAPFAGADASYIPNAGSLRLRGRGITADPRGNVYLLWQKPKEAQSPGDAQDANALAVYGPDGKVKNEKLVDAEIRSLSSVRVDFQGNLYLALGLRPGTDTLPPGLKGKLPAGATDPDAVAGVNFYPYIYGSIAKFGPEGGLIRKGAGGIPCNYNVGLTTEVKGARWIFPGASNVPSWRTGTPYVKPDICLCESPRFDVDGFGRSFFPDAGRFRAGVIDTAGNEIGWFGTYGNQDSAGPGSAVPVPDIPLCWPHAVAVGDEFVYVGDRLNRRVVRVKLACAAEESCPIQ